MTQHYPRSASDIKTLLDEGVASCFAFLFFVYLYVCQSFFLHVFVSYLVLKLMYQPGDKYITILQVWNPVGQNDFLYKVKQFSSMKFSVTDEVISTFSLLISPGHVIQMQWCCKGVYALQFKGPSSLVVSIGYFCSCLQVVPFTFV